MADGVLFFHGHFGHSLALFGNVEERIITEAIVASIEVAQDAVTAPFSRHGPAVGPDEDEGADIVDRALFRRKDSQIGDELLIIGFITCGREFGVKTVYTSIVLPLFLGLFEKVFPDFGSMTNSQELDVLCYILVVSVGLSILFNRNASSGGLDIVAKIMNKYLHMELGKAMSLSGMCVALSAALVYDKKTVVLSILGTYFNGIVLDHFIFDHNIKRRVCVITQKEEELRKFIIKDLHSGATIYEATGAYNMKKRNEIITIVDKTEYQKLMAYINHEDPKAFVTVYNVSDMRYQPKL